MSKRMRDNGRRLALAAGVLVSLATTGCGQIRDIGEEMGWIEPPQQPAPPPEAPSLEKNWVPAAAAVAGIPQSKWAQHWWQWVGRFPSTNELPTRDLDGRQCAQFQEKDGAVWFLAGTDGNFEAARSCRIPANKHLFVPLINWFATEGDCAQKISEARRFADHVLTGLVILDGRPIGDFQAMRVASGTCFAASGDRPAGATDGYWLMLSPLPAGPHVLAITAAHHDGGKQMLQNFQYKLEVEGTPVEATPAETEVAK
ncbi:hypothetical protein [Lysobacter tyrosinilyticus]